MSTLPVLLVAEDNPADLLLVREALRRAGIAVDLHVVEDGEAAFEFLDGCEIGCGPRCPQLALLDLNLPKRSGLEVLQKLRHSHKFGNIPVAMFTSTASPAETAQATSLGANRFFTKPNDFEQYMGLAEVIKDLLTCAKADQP